MLHIIFSSFPFYVCFFWSVILCVNIRRCDRAKRMLTVFGVVATVLYFCHMYYFNEGDNLFFEGLWVFCSLSVYPLFYLYLCCLTSEASVVLRFVEYVLPAAIVAVCIWCGATGLGVVAHKVVLMLQLALVGFAGYRRLIQFDCQLQEVYSDSDNFTSRPVRTLLVWFVVISLTSSVFNFIGRQYFLDSDWLLFVPSILFGVMLFSLFYVGYNRMDVIGLLSADLEETDLDGADSEKAASDVPMERISAVLTQLMEEEHFFLRPNIKISELAQQVGTCRTYLSTFLNQEMGMSFSEYINRQRIDYAKQIMAQDNYETMNQVASLSGFSSDASFFRNFKKFEGMTPDEWVNSVKEKAMR